MKRSPKTRTIDVSVSTEIYELLSKIAESGYGAPTIERVAEEMIRNGLDASYAGSGIIIQRIAKLLTG